MSRKREINRHNDTDAPMIGESVEFKEDEVKHLGSVVDIRPHLNDPGTRFAFIAVLGIPRLFMRAMQRRPDGSWAKAKFTEYTQRDETFVG